MDNPKFKVGIFLVLTLLLSAIGWAPIICARNVGAGSGIYILWTMWSPGIAAILTRLITQRNLRGQGWIPRTPKLLGLAFVLPLLYALPVYLLAWGIGMGTFDPSRLITQQGGSPATALIWLLSAGMFVALLLATGEEIGWRGLLVPELAKLTSFRNTVLISAAVWAAWHMPLVVGANYQDGAAPIAYSIACFSAMAFAMSVIMAWITLKSGSLWPAALLHASHNFFVQSVFDASMVDREATAWLTGEFGMGMVVTTAIAAWLVCRVRPPVGTAQAALKQQHRSHKS